MANVAFSNKDGVAATENELRSDNSGTPVAAVLRRWSSGTDPGSAPRHPRCLRCGSRRRMGAFSSKKRERKWNWKGPPGDHSPFPVDPFPYPGSDVLYCFIDMMLSFKFMRNQLNLGPQVITTDVEDNVDNIQDCYDHGFYLNEFIKVPGVRTTTEMQNWTERQPYQAILSKPIVGEFGKQHERWDIKVEKRILSTRTLAFDETDEHNDLLNTINEYAALGARLACAEPIGFVRSPSPNEQYGVIGVELFFNIPQHPNPTQYTYHAVKVCANYRIVPDATQTIQQIVCDADFMGQLRLFLDKGWKLVDIAIDTTAISEAYKMKATSKSVESIWFFEKESSKLFESAPQYEGVIIEYLHKVKSSADCGEVPCKDWRPVIAGMGVSGWELASIIQTPLLIQSSFTTHTLKLLMIFQRRIVPTFEKLRRVRQGMSLPHLSKPNSAPTTPKVGTVNARSPPRRSSTGQDMSAYNDDSLSMYFYNVPGSPYPEGTRCRCNGEPGDCSVAAAWTGIPAGEKPPSYWEAISQPFEVAAT